MIRKVTTARATKGPAPRSFRFTISTGERDREGDRIDPQGWRLDAYRRSPVILWAHNHQVPPIARSSEIGVVDNALKATAEFPPRGIHPLADQIHDLVAEGFLASASVGFLPLRSRPNRDGGRDIEEADLLEWSIVNVPALPAARLERRPADELAVRKWLGDSVWTPARSGSPVVLSISRHDFREAVREAFAGAVGAVVARLVSRHIDRLRGRMLDDEGLGDEPKGGF